ncbi:LysM peptidoglycan-binding domain-containing protein [Kribbella sandramycini]|uniref:LysM peptidoglycan-binding domain-containing protein n=1 Tax=Kribbella sandramycini TaxID=60450 RepID=A0A7Y4L5N4_9ACTN|nr:LysM domain-containing protein [Kribbella sandramycini]MBB6570505.1 hypothetical protein [Kribbella sandramycini]NOL43651.1 LysM peptidoglycan-binding domain-containing protein [Kribbella sandramycini]
MSTTALAANALTGRQAPEVAPEVAPRRRPRVAGVTTAPLPVRGCSGEELGRPQARVRRSVEAEAPALRLTRRGRALVGVLSVLVFGSAILVLGLRIAGVLESGPDFSHSVSVQVAPGDSLWSIAQETNPGADAAAVVEKIAELNQLTGAADVIPGQTLQVPIAR